MKQIKIHELGKSRKTIIVFFIVTSLVLVTSQEIRAEVICNGAACSAIPSNNLDTAFSQQYLNPVLNSMMDASILTNINSGMMGAGTINRFEIGANVSAAVVNNNDINFYYQGFNIPKLPNAGFSVAANFTAGVNLGFLLLQGASHKGYKGSSFLHRINIYAHGASLKYTDGDLKTQQPGLTFSGTHNSIGGTVRVELIKERYFLGRLFGFHGINVGFGHHKQLQSMNFNHQDGTPSKQNFGTITGRWDATDSFIYDSKVSSSVVDVKTGIRLLYFLTIFGGAGLSYNTGNNSMQLSRKGPFTGTTSTGISTADYTPEQQALFIATYGQDAYNSLTSSTVSADPLGISVNGYAKARSQMRFVNLGFQIHLSILNIIVEGMMVDKKYYDKQMGSLSVGIKVAL